MRQTKEEGEPSANNQSSNTEKSNEVSPRSEPRTSPTSQPSEVPTTVASETLTADESRPVGGDADTLAETGATSAMDGDNDRNGKKKPDKIIQLFKSSRLKGYLTLVLASIINYDAVRKSENAIKASGAIPSTEEQRNYATAVSLVSLILTGWATLVHLDTITPLQNVWNAAFKPKSRFELVLIVFLVIWWSVATGIQTSINGIAGDGKEQYSLYFSCWACCFASYWVLERWWVAAGLASMKSFITSWPYRSPGWLCIFFLGVLTLIWYLDLWKTHARVDPKSVTDQDKMKQLEQLLEHFENVPEIQWQLMIALIVFTIAPSAAFVLAEIFRQTKPDGSNEDKSRAENMAEGICLLTLNLAWIPSIIWVTSPDGAASLVGNAYFSSWVLVIFVAETGVWFVHDLRERIHQSLEQKQLEYREKQRQVIEKARAIQQQKAESPRHQGLESIVSDGNEDNDDDDDDDDDDDESSNDQNDSVDESDDSSSDYVDVLTEF